MVGLVNIQRGTTHNREHYNQPSNFDSVKIMALRNIRRVPGISSGLKAVESNSFRSISFESCQMKERKEPCEDSSYEAVKEAARRAGNPATEWIVGTSSMGSAVYKMVRQMLSNKCSER